MSRRIGRFSVSRELINLDPGVVARALGRVVVIRADSPDERTVNYTALGEVFDEVSDHAVIPEYVVILTSHYYAPMDVINYTVKFVRR